jgi:hypothetical protein
VFKCNVAGTPGTWKQIVPAAVTADPATGTIPTGYLILNVTQGTLKRHTGGYSWETVVGATGGKIGFYGMTPVVQLRVRSSGCYARERGQGDRRACYLRSAQSPGGFFVSARGENRPEAGRKPVRGRSNRPGQAGYLKQPVHRSSVLDRVGSSPDGSVAGSAESANRDSVRRMPRISPRTRFGELWLPKLWCRSQVADGCGRRVLGRLAANMPHWYASVCGFVGSLASAETSRGVSAATWLATRVAHRTRLKGGSLVHPKS